jgi:hypothetical protein
VEIDPASAMGAMMAELRGAIDGEDLAGRRIDAQPDMRCAPASSAAIWMACASTCTHSFPFKITFGWP